MDATSPDAEASRRLMTKLRAFLGDLEGDERQLFAALLAPGVGEVWAEEGEVSGFVDWRPGRLPDHLVDVAKRSNLRISIDDE